MKLLTRLRNIWKLGEEPIKAIGMDFGGTTGTFNQIYQTKEKPQMAQIVSMKPIEEDIEKLLEETNQEKNEDNPLK